MAKPITITDLEQQLREADQPVAVDFWAPWCPPCRAIAPHLEALADELAGRLTIAKLNVDDYPEWQARLGVMGLPTIIVFSGGREVGRIVGARPRAQLQAALEAALAGAAQAALAG
ncbi:MAG TPA: thioredoxin [Roseiflexaceae bacterium]|nr:thioredoxin [Roseiflexaceae bacterium]